MTHKLDRRDFIRRLLAVSATGVAWGLSGCGSRPAPDIETPTSRAAQRARSHRPPDHPAHHPTCTRAGTPASAATAAQNPTAAPTVEPAGPTSAPATAATAYLAVARGAGADPAELTRRAIAAIGGIERFVKPGANVIIKPNICNPNYGPEYAVHYQPGRRGCHHSPLPGRRGETRPGNGLSVLGDTAGKLREERHCGCGESGGWRGRSHEPHEVPEDRHPARQGLAVKHRVWRYPGCGRGDQRAHRQDPRLRHPDAGHEKPDGRDPGSQHASCQGPASSHRRSQFGHQAAAYHRGCDPHPGGQRPDRRQSGRRQAAGHHHRQRGRGRRRRLCRELCST